MWKKHTKSSPSTKQGGTNWSFFFQGLNNAGVVLSAETPTYQCWCWNRPKYGIWRTKRQNALEIFEFFGGADGGPAKERGQDQPWLSKHFGKSHYRVKLTKRTINTLMSAKKTAPIIKQ